MAAPLTSRATEFTRVTGEDATGDWTDSIKWVPDTGFPATVNDWAIFNTGATQRTISLDVAPTIGMLGVGYNPGSDAVAGNIVLQSGGPALTVGSIAAPGSIFIGAGTAASGDTATTSGTLVLASGTELNLVGTGSTLYMGGQSANTAGATGATMGTLMMEGGSKLNLGSSSDRADWFIGRKTSLGNTSSSGAFSATGGELTAYLGQLIVGQNVRGGNNAALKGVGILNLEGLDEAAINTVHLLIGHSTTSSLPAEGSMTLGDGHSLTVTGGGGSTVQIGVNIGGAGSGTTLINTSQGTLLMKAGAQVMFGTGEGSRSALTIGSNASIRGVTLISDGALEAEAGSTFTGYLSSLVIGSQSGTTEEKTYRGTGVMDLRLATVDVFDVSGYATIGYHGGSGEGSQGELRLANMAGRIGGDLFVGDQETGGGAQVSSSGLLELDGAHLEVGGNVALGLTGRTTVTVSGASAGLLLSSTSNLTIGLQGIGIGDPDAGYHITFQDPASGLLEPYYGLAWEGSHLESVELLVQNFSITWTNQMTGAYEVGIFYDSNLDLTYIGVQVIPEPSTTSLVFAFGVGLVLMMRRRRARGC